jgi:hypothetical protein
VYSALLVLVAGCQQENPAAAIVRPMLRQAVSGGAARALLTNGSFALPTGRQAADELSDGEATAIAAAWVKQYAPYTHTFLDNTRGGPIRLKSVQPCGRALYARSSFTTPPAELPAPFQRPYASWWLLTFCDVSTPVLSVAVSARATDLTLTNGQLAFPPMSGNEIFGLGIPLGHQGEFPSAPEGVVQAAAQRFGTTVISLPDLIMGLPSDGPPQAARWHLKLAAAVPLQRSTGAFTADEVFVGLTALGRSDLQTLVAAQQQPSEIAVPWQSPPAIGESEATYNARSAGGRQTAHATRRADTPMLFEPAVLAGGR